jgi:hypothetical protein
MPHDLPMCFRLSCAPSLSRIGIPMSRAFPSVSL